MANIGNEYDNLNNYLSEEIANSRNSNDLSEDLCAKWMCQDCEKNSECTNEKNQ